ncbi:MAG: hypothetical protein HFI34_08395 [Lachnospiraceae bacterium]|nr:hypothetical protein [Lachnospiraceae bacterium]
MDSAISELIKSLQENKQEDISVKQIQEQICEVIIQQVKKEERNFNFDELRKMYQDQAFWDEIEEKVIKQTKNFIKFSSFRHLAKESRVKLCRDVFDMIYFERENVTYIVEYLEYARDLAEVANFLLYFSEDIIFNKCFSKRRYAEISAEILGLEIEDAEFMWNLFNEHKTEISDIVRARRFNSIEQKIIMLNKKFDILQKELEYYILNEYDDTFDEEDE